MGVATARQINIQLAISDDLKGAANAMNAAASDCMKAIATYEAQYKVLRAAMSSVEQIRNTQTKTIANADTKAKELGISPSAVAGYADAEKAYFAIEKALDKANEY